MADPNDVAMTKAVRREFNRRKLDMTLADVRVSHGVVYVRGTIKAMRGGAEDPKEECALIARILRTRPEIRDVIIECIFWS